MVKANVYNHRVADPDLHRLYNTGCYIWGGKLMITLYSGTPGSGKSLHASKEIQRQLGFKRNVIANFPINMDMVTKKGKRKTGRFTYRRNDELTVPFLIAYAKQFHKTTKEGQTVIVIDEAGTMFNSREYNSPDRKQWLDFFATHRHYGYDFILIAQHSQQIDRQVRYKIEYDVVHRKANNFKTIGLMLSLFKVHTFVAIRYFYAMRNERISAEFFRYRKKDSKLYDTMMLFGGESHGETITKTSAIEENMQHAQKRSPEENMQHAQKRSPVVTPIGSDLRKKLAQHSQTTVKSKQAQKTQKQEQKAYRKLLKNRYKEKQMLPDQSEPLIKGELIQPPVNTVTALAVNDVLAAASPCETITCMKCVQEKMCLKPDKYWTPYMIELMNAI